MTVFDVVIIVILAASTMISVYRGLLREFLSLLVLVAALIVAIRFSRPSEVWLPNLDLWGYPLLGSDYQAVLLFVLLFVAVSLVGRVIVRAISKVVRGGLSGSFDRLLGAVFGLLRGGVMVVALVLLAGLTAVPLTDGWRSSLLLPSFERLTRYAVCYMPTDYQSAYYSCSRAGVQRQAN